MQLKQFDMSGTDTYTQSQTRQLQRIWFSLLRIHLERYFGLFAVIAMGQFLTTVAVGTIFSSDHVRVVSGLPVEARKVNMLLEVLVGFNRIVLALGVVSSFFLILATLNYAVKSRGRELELMNMIGIPKSSLIIVLLREVCIVALVASLTGFLFTLVFAHPIIAIEKGLLLAPEEFIFSLSLKAVVVSLTPIFLLCTLSALLIFYKAIGSEKQTIKTVKFYTVSKVLRTLLILSLLVGLIYFTDNAVPKDVAMIGFIVLTSALLISNYQVIEFLILSLLTVVTRAIHVFKLNIATNILLDRIRMGVDVFRPFAIVLIFLSPLSMVMATGRQAGTEAIYRNVTANSIAPFEINGGVLESRCADFTTNDLVPLVVLNNVYSPTDPYSLNAPIGLATCPEKLESVMSIDVIDGNLAEVHDKNIATTDSERRVGDHVFVSGPTGEEAEMTVVAIIKREGLLDHDFILDYDSRWWLEWSGSARFFSTQATTWENRDIPGVTIGEVSTIQASLEQANSEIIRSQRGALSLIFAVPLMIAFLASVTGSSSLRYMSRKDVVSLMRIGVRRRYIYEIFIAEVLVNLCVAGAIVATSMFLSGSFIGYFNNGNVHYDLPLNLFVMLICIISAIGVRVVFGSEVKVNDTSA